MEYCFFEVKKLLGDRLFPVFIALCFCLNTGLCFGAPEAREAAHQAAAGVAPAGEKLYDTLSAGGLGSFYYNERYINSSVLNRWMKEKYEKLQASIDRLDAQNADLSPFAGEMTPLVHKALFTHQCKAILLECMILISLLGLKAFSAERQAEMALLVYSSRRGRRVSGDKMLANGIVGGVYCLMLAGASLTVFFVSWDLNGLRDANMASSFHYVVDAGDPVLAKPFITWTSFTLQKYFFCSMALSGLILLAWWLFTNLVAVIAGDMRTGVMVLAGALCLPFFGLILLPKLSLSRLFYLDTLTLSTVVYCNQWWFTDLGNYSLFPWQEVWAVALHVLIMAAGLAAGLRYFRRKEIL